MSKKKKQEEIDDEDIIIGYNSKNVKKDNPPKKKKAKTKPKKKKETNEDEEEIIIGYNSKGSRKESSTKKKSQTKKVNKKSRKDNEEEIIIGYNSKGTKKDKQTNKKGSKKKKKKQKSKNRWRKVKAVLFFFIKLILIIGTIVGIGFFLFVSPVFNIAKIEVKNASKISENTYIALSEVQIGENIFKISTLNIKSKIEEESYVEEVKVERSLPGTVAITVTERTPKYMAEAYGGMFAYIDQNGYYLETNSEKLDLPILRGMITDINNLNPGDRIVEKDLDKFNDLIKIIDGVKNKNIEPKLSYIDISNHNNYILEFETENKKVMLGDTLGLSTKMIWIEYFLKENKNKAGIIHLDTDDVYFAPIE